MDLESIDKVLLSCGWIPVDFGTVKKLELSIFPNTIDYYLEFYSESKKIVCRFYEIKAFKLK